MADLLIELHLTYPSETDVYEFIETRIVSMLKSYPTFNKLKWTRYIDTSIAKELVARQLKEVS